MKSSLSGELVAGVSAGLAFIPLIIAIAVISFGAMGPEITAAMSITVLIANVLGGALAAGLAGGAMVVSLSSGSSALVMAGLFAGLLAHGFVPTLPEVMAITLSVVIIAGLAQLILMKAGAAALGPLAPYPVVAGLVNGTAVLILLSQSRPLLAYPFELVVTAVTVITMLKFPPRWKIPPVLPAIAVGMIAHAVLERLGLAAGPTLAAMPSPFTYPAMALGALESWTGLAAGLPWRAIVIAGVTAALLSVLETLATFSALSDLGVRVDERRNLRAVGLANLVVGAVGAGPAVSAPIAGGVGLWRMGGRGRAATISRLATIALGASVLGPYLPMVPEGALVGLVITIGLRLFDPEPARLLLRATQHPSPHRAEILGSAIVSFVVVTVALFAGLAVAVAVGAIACLLVFTAAMAGSAVRRVYDGSAALSRVRRGADETALLLRERHAIAVLELAGPLFFGNINPLGRALDAARAEGARHIIIDLARVVRVDMSGARRLVSTVRQRREHGLSIVLAPIRPGHPVADYLLALGIDPGACFAELTDALRALGIADAHAVTLAGMAETREMETGDFLCRAARRRIRCSF